MKQSKWHYVIGFAVMLFVFSIIITITPNTIFTRVEQEEYNYEALLIYLTDYIDNYESEDKIKLILITPKYGAKGEYTVEEIRNYILPHIDTLH